MKDLPFPNVKYIYLSLPLALTHSFSKSDTQKMSLHLQIYSTGGDKKACNNVQTEL